MKDCGREEIKFRGFVNAAAGTSVSSLGHGNTSVNNTDAQWRHTKLVSCLSLQPSRVYLLTPVYD